MPYSSGTYSLPSGNPVVTGTTISSSTTNTTNSDIATALSTCVLKDGTQTITANLPMASHKLTGLSAGTTAGDSVEYGGSPSFTNLAYTGTLTGSTGILNIGSGQLYKDASGNVGIGTSSPSAPLQAKGGSQWTATNLGAAIIADGTRNNCIAILNSTSTQPVAISNNSGAMTFHTGLPAIGTTTGGSFEQMRIDSSGNLLVGTTNNFGGRVNISLYQAGGQYGVVMRPSADSSSPFNFQNAAGTQIGGINCTSSATAYATSSDKRLKENIVDAPSALDSVNAIKVRSFDFISDNSHVDYGYIAQELLEVAPEAVHVLSNEDEMMGVDFGRLTPRLVKAIQEFKAIIDTQQEQINSLLGK